LGPQVTQGTHLFLNGRQACRVRELLLARPMLKRQSFDLAIDDHVLRVERLSVGAPTSAPTLVFLHDSLGSIGQWRAFPELLATRVGLDAVVYDRRGYGHSSHFAPTLRTPRYLEEEGEELGRVLDALDVRSAVLFGHSDGGSIALIAAAIFPQLVRGVITEGAHVFVEDETLAGIRHARAKVSELRERLLRHHGERTDGVLSAWMETWLSPEFRDWNIESYLARVVCPVLVIQGSDDEYGTEAQVRAIVNGVSGPAESLMIPGVGHTPHREASDIVLHAAVELLSKHGLGG
jgi:pimeloyl-ACP methyl ester carboxylesterase